MPIVAPFPGDPALSWHLIESLVAAEFDVTTCQEMLVDHGFTIPMSLLWPDQSPWPVRTVPIAVNTVQHPLPSPSRCYKFGRALGKAIESYPQDVKVVRARYRRPVAPTRRRARRVHQQGIRPDVHAQDRGRPGVTGTLFDP